MYIAGRCLQGYGGRLAGRSKGMDDLEGAVTARTEEDGRLIVSCDEPGCEHEFELRPLHLPQDTGSLADAFNAGWQISSDEETPDFCPQHSGTLHSRRRASTFVDTRRDGDR